MTGRAVGVAALAASLLVGGCSGGGGSTPPGARPPGQVRGTETQQLSCAAHGGREVRVEPAAVTRLLVCPLPSLVGRAVTLTPRSALFRPIVELLATSGARYGPGTVCPAYADVVQTVLASTAAVRLVVRLPTDSCGHYDRRLVSLLDRARHDR